MRELLLLAVTLVVSIAAVAQPLFGVLAYTWFGLMRPDVIAFSTGQYNYSFMLAVSMILGSWRSIGQIRTAWLTNPFSWMMVLLSVSLLISSQFAVYRSISVDTFFPFMKMAIAVLWIPILICTVSQMRLLFVVTALSLGAHAIWQSIGGVLGGGRAITHGIGGFMSENNTFAVGLVMVFPFCWYSRYLLKKPWLKTLLAVMSACSLFAIMLTHSRGAALAIVVVLLLLLLHSNRRMLVLLVLAAASLPGLYLVRNTYFDRLATIERYQEDTSAMSRVIHNKTALKVWMASPLVGVGIGDQNYVAASAPFLEEIGAGEFIGLIVHNSYLQIMVYGGTLAALCYIGLFVGAAWTMWRSSRRLARTHPGLEYYPRAIELSIVGYLAANMTQPRATFDFAYTVAMYAAAWYAIEKRLPAPISTVPLGPEDAAPPPPTTASVEQAYAGTTRLLGRHGQRSR